MNAIIERLEVLIGKVPEEFNNFTDSEKANRPNLNKWSKKEILGHLCDSATNNIHRFIKVQFEDQPHLLTSYMQNDWVSTQRYQDVDSNDIVDYWISLNKHVIRVIRGIPPEKLKYLFVMGDGKTVTLEWLIQDYLDHMEHHLQQFFHEVL